MTNVHPLKTQEFNCNSTFRKLDSENIILKVEMRGQYYLCITLNLDCVNSTMIEQVRVLINHYTVS